MTAVAASKPRLRGVFHQWSFVATLVIGIALVSTRSGLTDTIAASVYATAVAVMFGVSALFHRVNWSPSMSGPMLQLDKTGIYIMIAGSFTPIAIVGLGGTFAITMLVVFWTISVVLIVALWLPWTPPYGLTTGTYIGIGSLGVLSLPAMWTDISPNFTIMILLGGVLFIAGSFMLALRRPDPWPEVFGYHEVWHVVVMLATFVHFIAIAIWVF